MADKYKANHNASSNSSNNLKNYSIGLRNPANYGIIKNPYEKMPRASVNGLNKLANRKPLNFLHTQMNDFNRMSSDIDDFENDSYLEDNYNNNESTPNDNYSKDTKNSKDKTSKDKNSKNNKQTTTKSNNKQASKKTSNAKKVPGKKKINVAQMMKKKYVLIAGGVCFFFILMMTAIVSGKEYANLELTNSTNSLNGNRVCTETQIENRLIYLGDSRMVGMRDHLSNDNIHFIAESAMGYDWLTETAINELDNFLQEENAKYVVVLALGVNDLSNIDKYVTYYNELMDKYSNTNFYVLSVNPVDEVIESQNGYYVKNSDIEKFNDVLKENFSDNYIDTYSSLDTIDTVDGVNYNSSTNLEIHDMVISAIVDSGKVMCGGGDLLGALEEVGNWYIENIGIYDQGRFFDNPFVSYQARADCTGFVAVYMSYVAGVEIPISHTGEMIYPDGTWAPKAEAAGWIAYSSDEVGTLEPGDVMVAHGGLLYSDAGQHAEVYIDESHTFGWGSAWTSYPRNNVVTTSTESDGHVHFRAYNDYITVYRYEGDIANSSSSSDSSSGDLDVTKMYDSSFNHGTKPKSNQKYIMLHDTAMSQDAKTVVQSWKNTGKGVAAHFVIDRDGTIIQAVDLDTITHHAGWGGPGNYDEKYGVGNNDGKGNGDDLVGTTPLSGYTSYGMNSYSIGIELCHVAGEEYPKAQLEALDKVIAHIDSYYGFKSTIIDHKAWRPSNADTDKEKFSTYLNNYKTLRHH